MLHKTIPGPVAFVKGLCYSALLMSQIRPLSFKTALLLSQVYAHLAFLAGLFYFPLKFSLPVIAVCQVLFVGACGTAYYHRTVSHKNSLHPLVESFLMFLSWAGVSGSVIAWAGTHRMHHRYADTEKDPHSPIHRGLFRSYWDSSGNEDIVRYVPDLLRNKLYLFQHKHYFKFLIALHLLGYFALPLQWYWGLLITPAFLMWFAGSSVNAFCHTKRGSINIPILGYLHAGEGWHKNHHEQPSNSSFRHWADWGGHIHFLLRKIR